MKFRSRREPGAFFEGGRDQYLEAKVAAPQVDPPRFCNALEAINEPLGPLYKRAGFPWITLVLGSGCLEAGLDISSTGVREVPAIVRQLLADQPSLPDGTSPAKLASAFSASLIADRLGPPDSSGDADPGRITAGSGDLASSDADSFAATTGLKTAKLLLCAALLTRLYHLASAAKPDALSRTGHDKATLHTERAGSAQLETEALYPVLALLGELITSTNSGRTTAMGDRVLHQALKRIDNSLRPPAGDQPSIRVADIQLMTELCWYSLTEDTSVYPGWSDLLLHLSTRDFHTRFDRWPPRPAFDDIDTARDVVEKRYENAMRLSWGQLTAKPQSDRERFYATVAGVLRQQALLRSNAPQSSPVQPPIASAFITSFDLELEMAMWRSSTEPFIVAVPMNLLQDVAEPHLAHLASVCWLGCLIRPDHNLTPAEQLSRLRSPAEEDWFLLNGEGNYELTYGNYPVLVRMSGSPLMTAPQLLTDDGKWNDLCHRLLKYYPEIQVPTEPTNPRQPELRMAHVALLDEYSALQHVASEFYIYQPDGESKARVRHGLPAALTGTQGSAFARFWMLMGVQASDSSIRYRFASQMMVPWEIEGAYSKDPPTPKRTGVVVNWRTDDTVRDLLGWYNFDVVKDRCETFRRDLQHYLRHLQSDPPKSSARETCELT